MKARSCSVSDMAADCQMAAKQLAYSMLQLAYYYKDITLFGTDDNFSST